MSLLPVGSLTCRDDLASVLSKAGWSVRADSTVEDARAQLVADSSEPVDCILVATDSLRGPEPLEPTYRERLLGLFATGLTVDQINRYAAVSEDERDVLHAIGGAHQQPARTMNLYCVPAIVEARDALTYQMGASPTSPRRALSGDRGRSTSTRDCVAIRST